MKIVNIFTIILLTACALHAQTAFKDTQWHRIPGVGVAGYTQPRKFSFITQLPRDAVKIASLPFKKDNLPAVVTIVGSTAILFLFDQSIADGVTGFCSNMGISGEEKYRDIITIPVGNEKIGILKLPLNINTAFYQLGQGFPSLLIGAGLFTVGKIRHDYRALNTANQLAESFFLMGAYTQVLKRISGRQSPSEATKPRGEWHFFPSFKDYQQHTANYDAFPSGHLATMMTSVTVLAENYPEIRWIKPVGYSLTGLLALSMINNEVHWASDYPLAIALGYVCAKQVTKHNRKIIASAKTNKNSVQFSWTINYFHGQLLPGIKCIF